MLNNSIKVQEKKRKLLSCVPVLDKKCEIRDFHVVVTQRQQNMTVQKESDVRAKLLQSYCFANINLCSLAVLVAVAVVVA